MSIAKRIAGWSEMPDKLAILEDHYFEDEANALRDRLRDMAAALEVNASYCSYCSGDPNADTNGTCPPDCGRGQARAILERLAEEGLVGQEDKS